MLPDTKRMQPIFFFTRPQLNMTSDNLRNMRKLAQLMSSNPQSMQTYIRAMLDPRMIEGVRYPDDGSIPGNPGFCTVIDNQCAFIPPLTNNCTSSSGWPSIAAPTFTSTPGQLNQSFGIIDGLIDNHEAFDLSFNFADKRGSPVTLLIYAWICYAAYVYDGRLMPYVDMIVNNRIDYNTRIYAITLDYQRETILEMAATHAAFPVGIEIGSLFDYSGDKPYSDSLKDITVSFKCFGVDYFDPILIKEFNTVVGIFNPSMRGTPVKDPPIKNMIKVPLAFMQYFNFKGYPHINTNNGKLEWYVTQEEFNTVTSKYVDMNSTPGGDEYEGDI
jgi:hypothetical protein